MSARRSKAACLGRFGLDRRALPAIVADGLCSAHSLRRGDIGSRVALAGFHVERPMRVIATTRSR